ncbi:SDR family NAD(P)-dependent oxidoreductase [Pontixanthobacter sp.]|uniref:SDR family NAD(P)-dependent oxidoreductase n=1 Tax=Pontixanthobacter sp. TaxID=2792078 RepID=UPI003C7BE783
MDKGSPQQSAISTAAIFGASGGIGRALAETLRQRGVHVWAGSRSTPDTKLSGAAAFRFDLTDENSIKAAAGQMRDNPPQLVIAATGILTLADGTGPERSYRKLDPQTMMEVIQLNTVGPAIIAKHMLPLLPRNSRSIFAALSARVGSITDNGLGGWHSYRASKAALNMLLKNFAIELGRTHKQAIIAGLHPGTVDSELSRPFQSNLPDGQLSRPGDAASQLLDVLDGLTPADSGRIFAYDGQRIAP